MYFDSGLPACTWERRTLLFDLRANLDDPLRSDSVVKKRLAARSHNPETFLPATYLQNYCSSNACGFDSFAVTARMCDTTRRAAAIHDSPCARVISSRTPSALLRACPEGATPATSMLHYSVIVTSSNGT